MSNEDFASWLEARHNESEFHVNQTPLTELRSWRVGEDRNLTHHTGRFFSVEGLKVVAETREWSREWAQPIIVQPEIGILGILAQRRQGVLHFMMQAKKEPGNVNGLQLSPCVQATLSNYSRVHKGKATAFLEHFLDPSAGHAIVDQLQSEHSARFLQKRNRNVVIQIPDDEVLETPDRFCWLTLGQLKRLMREDNLINMNARTVIGCIPFELAPAQEAERFSDPFVRALFESLLAGPSWQTTAELVSWLTRRKCDTRLTTRRCGIRELEGWRFTSDGVIAHNEGRYFEVLGVDVQLSHREIAAWQQPLVRQLGEGLVGVLLKRIHGVLHMLVRSRVEAGNLDLVEIGPTVQCVPEHATVEQEPFLEWFTEPRGTIRYDAVQSEEGGRFYHDQNRTVAIEVDDAFPTDVPTDFTWITLHQAKRLIQFSNVLNIGVRSLLAALSPV